MLTECLESLAAQITPLHEVVVVDDGGSGSAREIVARFGPRFRYLWQPNGGQPSARNLGAKASTGDWIAFLDDDDLWLPNRNARVAELIATDRVDLISGDFTKFGEDWMAPTGVFDEIAQQSPGFWDGISRESGANFEIIGKFPTTRLLPVSPFWPSTLVLRRELFERLNGWNENLRGIRSEDNEFCFRAIKNGILGIILPSTILYRSHSGNESSYCYLNSIGRTRVWEEILLGSDITDTERRALISVIEKTSHEIIWSAFLKRKYAPVIEASVNINRNNLTIAEKVKVAIAMLAIRLEKQLPN